MTRHLGIDVGGSAARWRCSSVEGATRAGEAAGFSGHLYRPEVHAAAEASLATIARDAGAADVVVAGVTGLTAGTGEAAALEALIATTFRASRVRLLGDGALAYLTLFAPGEGALVYAGTGSAALHVAKNGALLQIGGKGVVIDDAGGGHWIATRALRSVLRREDEAPGSAWSTPLGVALAARIGGSDWPRVRQAVYGGDRGSVGLLALAAGEAAAAGDAAALGILAAAGRELAALALAMERRVGLLPLALGGRAAHHHPIIFDGFEAAMPGRSPRLVAIDAAAGALRLAVHDGSHPPGEGQIGGKND